MLSPTGLCRPFSAEADGYVTGLEPGTGFPYNRKVEASIRPDPEKTAKLVKKVLYLE